MVKVTRDQSRRKPVKHAAPTGGTWMQNLAARLAANLGRENGSQIRRYEAGSFAQGRAGGRHDAGLNCITVALNDGSRCYQEPAQGTVGSPTQAAPVQAHRASENVEAPQIHRCPVVRACSQIWEHCASAW